LLASFIAMAQFVFMKHSVMTFSIGQPWSAALRLTILLRKLHTMAEDSLLDLPLLPTTVIAAVRTLSLPHSPWAMPEDGLDVLQTVLTAAAAVASAAARANVTVRYADGAF